MSPVTRLQLQQNRHPFTRLQARKMDVTQLGKVVGEPPYYTRSSPKKVNKATKETTRQSFRWDDERRSLFFTLRVEEQMAGKRAGGGMKPESLKKIAGEMNSRFDGECAVTQVRNFWNKQKKLWSLVNWLRYATGLGVDPLNACITADEDWWNHALQVKPELKSLQNKNIEEIIHYGDILFKNVTSTGEHVVYPSTICGVQGLPELTGRLDLNVGPDAGHGRGSGVPVIDFTIGGISPEVTPSSRSSRSSKRKSVDASDSNLRGKMPVVGSHLLDSLAEVSKAKAMKEPLFPSMDDCWAHLREIRGVNSKLAMYGSVLLEYNPQQRNLFLGWGTLEEKVEWLEYMEMSGYK